VKEDRGVGVFGDVYLAVSLEDGSVSNVVFCLVWFGTIRFA
jgi:hypothetical protein